MKRSKDYLQLADALQVSAFISSWWKQLKKKVNACNQSKEQKIMIYSKLAKGLFIECCKLADNNDDLIHINHELEETQKVVDNHFYGGIDDEEILDNNFR